MRKYKEWTLALLLGAVLVAPAAWAGETADETREQSREKAREAHEEAARDAAKAVREATQLDLDIRLIGPTSLKVAGRK